jgi:predicted DCC family thiol-disulfide oxidoreductase YuxK
LHGDIFSESRPMAHPALTVWFDGAWPLCRHEIALLLVRFHARESRRSKIRRSERRQLLFRRVSPLYRPPNAESLT